MLEELNAITKELDQFRKSTNTKMSYPKVIKDKVIALLDKDLNAIGEALFEKEKAI